MEGQQKRQWGVTSAISEAQPTEADLKLNDQLVDALKNENNFESPESTDNRVKVLNHMQRVAEEFVRRVGKKKGLPQSTVDDAGGRIFTFGSYALGVYGPSSDIDTLCVAPKHVSMDDFFNEFPATFRDMSKASEISEFVSVKESYVPIIKLEYCGVSIDLLFASLPTVSSVHAKMDMLDKTVLRGLDDSAMRSVNGTRVCSELLDSVPQVKSFRHALRAVKLWSNRRGIYGAVSGYPGGIAWAIMVARICQLYPFACGATILSKFFNLMMKWHWPRPVMLKAIEDGGGLGLRVWNPSLYPQDRAHLMPIITPAFPSMCATHTIMHSTKSIMIDEFKRAENLVHQIYAGKKNWGDLFERHTFFTKDHKYYLSVIASSRSKEENDAFSGLVKSKVRLLVKGIEDGESAVEIARPFHESVDRIHRCKTEDEIDRIIQGNMDFKLSAEDCKAALEGTDVANGQFTIYTSTFYIGLTLPEGGNKSLDISFPVSEFKRFITTSETYNADTMSVRVVHTRNFQLPEDVFQPGEAKPEKPVKERRKKGKRSFAETGLNDSEHASTKRRESEINGLPTPTPV